MKLSNIYLLLLLSAMLPAGCSDGEGSATLSEPIPIELHAAGTGLTAVTKADAVSLATTVFASTTKGDYTQVSPGNEYNWQASTTISGDSNDKLTVNLSGKNYPETGDWIYLVAVAPTVTPESVTDGTVAYTLDGKTDLLYAKEIMGNKRNGSRFTGNTILGNKETPLEYAHLLTQLTFKAKKELADGLTVKVQSITVKDIKSKASIVLSDGSVTFSQSNQTAENTVTLKAGENGTDISGSEDPSLLGSLLLPPLNPTKSSRAGESSDTYRVTVETSVGTFTDVPLTFEGASAEELFQPGHSHEITLTISDRELEVLSVNVAPWITVAQDGELDLID